MCRECLFLIEIGNSHINHNHVIHGMEVSDNELSSPSAIVHVVVGEVSLIKVFCYGFKAIILSRLTVVSHEAKKQQASALQDHTATTGSNLHGGQL